MVDVPVFQSTEELKAEFDAAKVGCSPDVIDRVMRGLPIETSGDDEGVRTLRLAWSKYHERIKYSS